LDTPNKPTTEPPDDPLADAWLRVGDQQIGWPIVVPTALTTDKKSKNYWRSFTNMFRAGALIGQQVGKISPDQLVKKAERQLERDIFHSRTETWRLAKRAIFWFSAYLHAPKHHAWSTWFGARTQHDLIQALLGMTPEDLLLFSDSVYELDRKGVQWRFTLAGAMATSRMIHALNWLGVQTALPHLMLDLNYKIDLLARDGERTLCFQIKSNYALVQSRLELLWSYYTPQTEEEYSVRERIKRFSADYGVPCLGVMAYVGRDDADRWDLTDRNNQLTIIVGTTLQHLR
jgi:hypothetical protein